MNEPAGKKNRPLLGFYILVIYVVLQFSWWSFLMFSLNNELYGLKTELNILKTSSPTEATVQGNDLQKKLHARWAMIIGEGTVFFVLLVSGIIITRSSFKKENDLNLQQNNFILSITHELRSPLASARLQIETLALRELCRDKQKEIIQGALNDIDRLNALVENILIAARIEDRKFRIHKEKTDIGELITTLIPKTQFEIRDKRIIQLNLQPGVFAHIDRFSFPSIIINLYENAVKYSSPGTTIGISLKETNDKVTLLVSDEGIGISEADKKLIFKKFYRTGNEETRTAKGTGLGLYIVKYLSQLHGGTISVRDNSPKGSIFELVLSDSNPA
jgi:two-component system phosphate regulon sensor histidine kinase PhoR